MLADLLRARTAGEPDAHAFVVAGGDALTYRSWESRSDALCRGLLHRGVGAGDRVVLCFDARRWTDFAIAYAGVHKAGAVPVLVGPQVPTTALVRAVSQSGASGVVTSSPPVGPEVLGGLSAWVAGPGELEDTSAPAEVPAAPAPDLAHITYRFRPLQAFRPTSSPAGDLLAVVDDAGAPAGGAPLLHAFDPVAEGGSRAVWMPLGRRPRPVIVLPTFDPDALCALTAAHGAACWSLAPATAGWLLDSGALPRHDLASVVRLILLDGQASPALRSRLTAHLPAASVVAVPAGGDGAEGVRRSAADVPAAFSQEGMLWHEVFAPGSQNLPPLVRRYRGALDVTALERALAEIVRRHEPLRTTFEVRDGRPVQVVSPPGDWDLGTLDLSGLDPEAQDEEVASLLAAVGRPFDLVSGPMFEASLVRLGPDDHLVVLRVHHAVYDDWSVGVFRRELSTLYPAFAAGGEPSPLADLPLSFSDFSLRQHQRLAGPRGATELEWWKDHLAGAPLSLQLPIADPERPPGAPQASAEPVSVHLGPELSAQLRALARRERTTLFMTLLAAFEVLVHRYTGQEELLAASVVANRNRPELEAMVGCFTKKVLVRLDGSGDPTFAELLPRVRTAVVGALGHQDLPFETVLQGSLGARAAVHGLVPQVSVMFQGVTPRTEAVVLPGLETSGYDTSATTTRTHFSAGDENDGHADAVPWGAGLYLGTFLILSVIEDVEQVSLAARGAFHGPSVQRLLATFQTLLADIVAHPTKRISELRLLGDDERAGLVRGRGVDPPPVGHASEVFEAQVARHPTRTAIVDGAGHLSYADLDARAEALSGRLRDRGVGPGTLVGVGSGSPVDAVVAALAVWKAGAGYVAVDGDSISPLSATVPGLPDDADPVAVVVYGSGAPAEGGEVVIGHRGVVHLASGLETAVFSASDTSGSPRGVRLSARPGHDAFLRQLVALLHGHRLHLAEGADEAVSGVRAGDIDVVDCSPAELRDLVAAGLAPALEARVAGGPPAAVVVGSPSPIDRAAWRTLRSLPAVAAHHLYGPPECTFGAAIARVSAIDRRLLLGSPLGNGVAVVLDAQGEPAPEQVSGELFFNGTATSYRPFRTGQRARRLPGGGIELLGTIADTVDLRGFPVDRAMIADALRQCPGVADVDIVLRHDIEGEPFLVARLVLDDGARAPGLPRLRTELWGRLPGYAWPAAIEVVGGPVPREQESPEASMLASLWAEQVAGPIETNENYWQSFSFLEAISRARELGIAVSGQEVVRNRTVATLATTLAAERLRRDGTRVHQGDPRHDWGTSP